MDPEDSQETVEAMTTSETESAEQGSHTDMDPKLFKTSLCSFYLQGTCKKGAIVITLMELLNSDL